MFTNLAFWSFFFCFLHCFLRDFGGGGGKLSVCGFLHFGAFPQQRLRRRSGSACFPCRIPKNFLSVSPIAYVPPSHWSRCLQNLSISGFLTCRAAHDLALSPLPTLTFECTLLCECSPSRHFFLSFYVVVSVTDVFCCLSTSSLFWVAWGIIFQGKGLQTCLLRHLESKSTLGHFSMVFNFPGGKGTHFESCQDNGI